MKKYSFITVVTATLLLSLTACQIIPSAPTENNFKNNTTGRATINAAPETAQIEEVPEIPEEPDILEGYTLKGAEEFVIDPHHQPDHEKDELIEATDAYFSFLDNYELSNPAFETLKFEFIYLDDNNVPELAVCTGNAHCNAVEIYKYDYNSSKVISLGSFGEYGIGVYYSRQNLAQRFFMGMGYTTCEYVSFTDSESFVLQSFEDNEGTGEDEIIYTIDGHPFDYDTYCEYSKKWDDTYGDYHCQLDYNLMSPYTISAKEVIEANVFTYEYEQETLDAAGTAYMSFLINSCDDTYYDFIFLNDDNIPELITAYSNAHLDMVSVYTYDIYNDSVIPIGEYGEYGTLVYVQKRKIALSSYYGMGYCYDAYVTYSDYLQDEYVSISFNNNVGAVGEEDATYSIFDCPVSYDRFVQMQNLWDDLDWSVIYCEEMNLLLKDNPFQITDVFDKKASEY